MVYWIYPVRPRGLFDKGPAAAAHILPHGKAGVALHILLERYKTLVDFLGQALGSDYEVVLHDLSEESNAIVAIANGHISGRSLGAPLTAMALRFLADREYEQHDYKVGYRGISQSNAQLRASTMFIKDQAGQVIGMLCVNFDPTRCVQAANAVLAMCGLPQVNAAAPAADAGEVQGVETFVSSLPDMVRGAIEEVTGRAGIPPSRLTMEEKIRIVEALHRGGVFYLKGAVSEVAAQLASSEATVYRYLSKLKN